MASLSSRRADALSSSAAFFSASRRALSARVATTTGFGLLCRTSEKEPLREQSIEALREQSKARVLSDVSTNEDWSRADATAGAMEEAVGVASVAIGTGSVRVHANGPNELSTSTDGTEGSAAADAGNGAAESGVQAAVACVMGVATSDEVPHL